MSARLTVEVNGVHLPCLARRDSDHGFAYVVPLENGWNAYVVGYPRPDETEFSVAPITSPEAEAVARGNGASARRSALRVDRKSPGREGSGLCIRA